LLHLSPHFRPHIRATSSGIVRINGADGIQRGTPDRISRGFYRWYQYELGPANRNKHVQFGNEHDTSGWHQHVAD
jgi:hypothetical protein